MEIRWKPPPNDYIKYNIDAALFEGTKNFGIGMCLRDKHDNFIKAKSSNISGNPSPREVEAWALHKALQWLEQLQLSNVTIESDCKVVTDNFNSCCKGISDYNVNLNKCRQQVSSIPNSMTSFIKRQVNLV